MGRGCGSRWDGAGLFSAMLSNRTEARAETGAREVTPEREELNHAPKGGRSLQIFSYPGTVLSALEDAACLAGLD